MAKIIICLLLYIIIPKGIFIVGKLLKNQIKQALFGRNRSRTTIRLEAQKEGLNKKISKRVKFTMTDPRKDPISYKMVFITIRLLGAVIAVLSAITGNWYFMLISILVAYGAVIFSYKTANPIVTKRDETLSRMLELKGSKMRYVNRDKNTIVTPDTEFKVLQWGEDLVSPAKMYLYMPTDFDILEVDSFLESFNLIFGSNGQWVSDDTDEQYRGFDFNAGVAAIRVSPKLPEIAMWDERYLNPEHIHWSFFPLALGSENGVPVPNEETGEIESVLGFAVNSGQAKLSSKKGVKIGPEITAAPQVLISGATGGGKSLSTSTVVNRVIED